MKKFLKAVALATVMCMLLSVSAFAAVGGATGNKTAKTIDITIATGATAAEEVAVLIIDSEKTLANAVETDIMYINQVTTDASGNAEIKGVKLLNDTKVVDVYIGSAKLGTAQQIGDDIDLNDVKKITIVGDEYFENVMGAGNVKGGVAAALTVNLNGLTVDKMIWAFKVGNDWKYSKSIAASNLNGSLVDGAVQYAVALDAFNADMSQITVSDVAAIFLTTEAKDNEHVVGTEDDLMDDKKTN